MEENRSIDPKEELFLEEERCQKTIKTVGRALFMRLVVAVLMVWVAMGNRTQVWAWGLAAFVLLVDLTGGAVLWKEYRKQRKRLKDLIAQEED